MHFSASVLTGDEEWDRVPVGGTIWTDYAALQHARYLEVFLDGTPSACEIRLWQRTILDAPTAQPIMSVHPSTE